MSLQELRKFLYTGSSIDLTDFKSTNDLIVKLDLNVAQLVAECKGDEIIKEIVDYYKFYLEYYAKKSANTNLDSMALVLASCSKIRKNEQFSHLGIIIFLMHIGRYRKDMTTKKSQNPSHTLTPEKTRLWVTRVSMYDPSILGKYIIRCQKVVVSINIPLHR